MPGLPPGGMKPGEQHIDKSGALSLSPEVQSLGRFAQVDLRNCLDECALRVQKPWQARLENLRMCSASRSPPL